MKHMQQLQLAPEVFEALTSYNTSINSALNAVQKLEAIHITTHLAQYFWVSEQQAAKVIQEDYLVSS